MEGGEIKKFGNLTKNSYLCSVNFLNQISMKPREYEGPLDTPEDFAFAEAMCRFAKSLTKQKKTEDDQDK